MEKWIIKPCGTPAVRRRCSKCGINAKFVCSGHFRMNANGKNVDVWLIYKCNICDTTWNMEILSRTKPDRIERSLYAAFEKNDPQTAEQYAFNQMILNQNKADVCYDDIGYTVEKQAVDGQDYVLEIISPYDFGLRLDRLLSDQLGVSRQEIKSLIQNNKIILDDTLTVKTKVKNIIRIKKMLLNDG